MAVGLLSARRAVGAAKAAAAAATITPAMTKKTPRRPIHKWWHGAAAKKRPCLAVYRFGRRDLDTEAAETNVCALARREQADRGDAQVLQNLRAQADLAPLPRARSLGAAVAFVRDFRHRHAGGAVAQINDDAAAFRLKALQRGAD